MQTLICYPSQCFSPLNYPYVFILYLCFSWPFLITAFLYLHLFSYLSCILISMYVLFLVLYGGDVHGVSHQLGLWTHSTGNILYLYPASKYYIYTTSTYYIYLLHLYTTLIHTTTYIILCMDSVRYMHFYHIYVLHPSTTAANIYYIYIIYLYTILYRGLLRCVHSPLQWAKESPRPTTMSKMCR